MSKWKLVNPDRVTEWVSDKFPALVFGEAEAAAVAGWLSGRLRKAFDREVGRLVAEGVDKWALEDAARHVGVYELVQGTFLMPGWKVDHGFREAGGRQVAFAPDDGHEAAFAARLGLPADARPWNEIWEMVNAVLPKRAGETHQDRYLRLAAMGLGSSREARRIVGLRQGTDPSAEEVKDDLSALLASCPLPLDDIARKAWDWAVGTGKERAPGGIEGELGWVRLATPDELDRESELMSHCVGKGGYDEAVASGRTEIWSLRDDAGTPWATAEIRDGFLRQFKGPRNAEPIADCYRCLPGLGAARSEEPDVLWHDAALVGWVPATLPDRKKAWIDLKDPGTAANPSANLGDRLPTGRYEGLALTFPRHVEIDELRVTTGCVLPETVKCRSVWIREATPEETAGIVDACLSGKWDCEELTAEASGDFHGRGTDFVDVPAVRRGMDGTTDIDDVRSAIVGAGLTEGGTGPLEPALDGLTARLGTLLSGDERLLAKVAEGFTWDIQGLAFKASSTTVPEAKAVASLVGTAALARLAAKDPNEVKELMDCVIWQPVASMVATALEAGLADAAVVASHPAIRSALPAEAAAMAEQAFAAYAATPEGRSRLTSLAMAVGTDAPKWAVEIERVVAEAAPPRRGMGRGPMEAASRAASGVGRGSGVGFGI